jgi:hypothetical protein
VGGATATALIFYFHYVYALVLLAQAAYLLWVAAVEKRTAAWKQLAAAWGGVVVLIVPLVGHVVRLAQDSGKPVTPVKPSFLALAMESAPWPLLFGLAGAAALVAGGAGLFGRARQPWKPVGGGVWLLLLVWGAGNAAVLFLVTHATALQLFTSRYVAQTALGAAVLLTGAGFTVFSPRVAIRWAFLGVLLSTGSPAIPRPSLQWRWCGIYFPANHRRC